ncbi:MAG: (2Fe-2S) ferredoxin domain-containing protein [Okeania sp. SIO3I5]|uniref:(2Fe-2S) ferredoxin domain-containing protein n=1 Tax=Okeania sp. SIO3I5 TaxID=2607805 RepID=UPI0013B6817C|nr:(2Fe-2S) ferredoxin domain-containing protein [Okeania sp. SIO3I5]NEQ39190.1 (2Fe-2S) ferredoxin domain-containing protein [Okeania sp. SIO3I5]
MSKFKHQKKFSLSGKVQEVTLKDGYKVKYVHVETPAGNNYVVKVAKGLRRNFSSVLIPGLGVKMTGEMTVCKKTGEEELKAYKIIPDCSKNAAEPCPNQTWGLLEKSSSQVTELKLPETEGICSKSQKVTGANAKCAGKKAQILVCQKSDCQKRGAGKVCQALSEALSDRGLEDQVTIKKTGCLKKCKAGPNMIIMPNKAKYSRISSTEIPEVIEKHFALEA